MIRIDHATWTYPHAEQPSLRDLNLRINPGEFVILCGASGSGKSTALRLMNGLIPHFHEDGVLTGTVTVGGLVTTNAELDAMGLVTGTVLQHPKRQFFTDTAPEEVAFAMENFGFPPEEIRRRVVETVEELSTGCRSNNACGISPAVSSNRSRSPLRSPTAPASSCWMNPARTSRPTRCSASPPRSPASRRKE